MHRFVLLVPMDVLGLAGAVTMALCFVRPSYHALCALDGGKEDYEYLLAYFVLLAFIQTLESCVLGLLTKTIRECERRGEGRLTTLTPSALLPLQAPHHVIPRPPATQGRYRSSPTRRQLTHRARPRCTSSSSRAWWRTSPSRLPSPTRVTTLHPLRPGRRTVLRMFSVLSLRFTTATASSKPHAPHLSHRKTITR